jgi:hypothetical protein
MNPHSTADAALIEAIGRGEFSTCADCCSPTHRYQSPSSAARLRPSPAKLLLLRAHHLIRKVPLTHRYHLTDAGRIVVTALLTARRVNTQELTKLAALPESSQSAGIFRARVDRPVRSVAQTAKLRSPLR